MVIVPSSIIYHSFVSSVKVNKKSKFWYLALRVRYMDLLVRELLSGVAGSYCEAFFFQLQYAL